jgi:hypothetical protein
VPQRRIKQPRTRPRRCPPAQCHRRGLSSQSGSARDGTDIRPALRRDRTRARQRLGATRAACPIGSLPVPPGFDLHRGRRRPESTRFNSVNAPRPRRQRGTPLCHGPTERTPS